jgi:hypothetical protein
MSNTNTTINLNDTQNLDAKKNNSNKSSSSSSLLSSSSSQNTSSVGGLGSYITSIVSVVITIIIYFIFGAITLYECKLAQSNILPTDLECYPYTETRPQIQQIVTNIFITNTDPQESVKLGFPYDKYNSKSKLLDMFRKYKEMSNSSFFLNYFISIFEGLINFSNNALNSYYNLLNGTPELFIVLLGPIISLFYFCVVPFVGLFVIIYYYFSSMKWFFKENVNTNSNNNANWKDINLLEPFRYGSAWFLVFVFFILFWVLLFTFMPLIPFIVFYMCIFFSLGYKGEINNEKVSLGHIIKNIFKHYKLTIMIIFTIFIIVSAFSNLGTTAGVFSIITVVLIYFNIIPIKIFQAYVPPNLTPVTSFDQAEKKCSPISNKPKSLLENIQNFFDIQKGGRLTKELKKLSKKMQS